MPASRFALRIEVAYRQTFDLAAFSTKYYLALKLKQPYCSSNQVRNFSKDTDSITIGIELCSIPHISEHCRLSLRLSNVINKI